MRPEALLHEVGRRLRRARTARGLSMAETAAAAGLSTRYLRMAEGGDANLSLLKLAALARALRLPLRELCDLDLSAAPSLRLALLGVRGAGKSSVGRQLAQQLEVPFVELDALVEERAGMRLGQLFGMHGEQLYRQLQAEALEAWLTQHGSGVLATGGSLVEDRDAYERLRATCRTVWLAASADTLWQRVVDQGDLRPMRDHPRARAELQSLLDARRARYALADLALETDARSVPELVRVITDWALDDVPAPPPARA